MALWALAASGCGASRVFAPSDGRIVGGEASDGWGSGAQAGSGQAGDAGASDAQAGGEVGAGAEVPGALPACSGMCDSATPDYPTVSGYGGQGNVTMYTTSASNGGACNYGSTDVLYFAAANVNVAPGDGQGQWQGGRICGQCAKVTVMTSYGPQSVLIRIMDKCPDGYCGMDLGGVAPAQVMLDGFGRYNGSWAFVSCAGHAEVFDGPTSLFVLAGASAYYARVQIRNPPAAVTGLLWSDSAGGSGTLAWADDPENSFEVPASILQSNAASVTVVASFSDDSASTVVTSPTQLATGDASYQMN